jgi:hypothetical protein
VVAAAERACVTDASCFPPQLLLRLFVAGQVKDRAEPGRRGGAAGVLEVIGHEPDDRAAGRREPVSGTAL